jgi:hypothetical protein
MCVLQCGQIQNLESYETCGQVLGNTTKYYDIEGRIDLGVEVMMDIARPVLSAECADSILFMLCNANFRECQAVMDSSGGRTWLPSLMVVKSMHPRNLLFEILC